ncbi:helix-turn-helix domain-containing protein [Streptosporangium algeriense]|uniref:Helix-turn-helix domain-containing protein n=1 Tax=Streptosporangium algeriense TaxID=1682748 RepID=A0ABW3DM44_9ACTN
MHDQATIGARLRALRRWRRMSLEQLAGQAGLSKSFLSMAERGQRILDRRSHIAALASALRVSETELVGAPHLGRDPEQSGPHRVVPILRAALTGNTLDDPATDQARSLGTLHDILFGEIADMRDSADYVRRAQLVAPVIDELHWHVATGDEADRRHALRLLIEACHETGVTTLKSLGHQDLAYLAAARANEAATLLDEPLTTAYAAYLRARAMPKGDWDRPLRVASIAADRLEPHAGSRDAGELYGMLHLTAALSAAAISRPALAADHLAEARSVAVRLGERQNAFGTFGPTNVALWDIAIAMEHGDYGQAVAVSSGVVLGPMPNMERRAVFHADRGRAFAHLKGELPGAVTELRKAEHLAPQIIRNNPVVQETVLHLLGRPLSASLGREVRGMAARMGIPH